VRWVGVGQIGRLTLQFLSISVLSRLLSTQDFGLMAMATVVSNLGFLFRDLGTAAALIQKNDLTDDLIDTVFWLNVAFGVVVGLFTAISAPIAAHFFHASALLGVLLSLSLTFPVTATGASQLALLERQHRFRTIARIEVSSAVAGLATAIVCALKGFGVYSFVLQAIVIAVLSSLQIWLASSHRHRWRWSLNEFKGIFRFSGNLTIFSLVNYFSRNADSMLIGRFLGELSLGWYSIAYRILLFPLQNFTAVSSRALLPIYSRYQDDQVVLRRMYVRTLAIIGSITCPLMMGLWALRYPFVEVAFGAKWMPVAHILAWFAPMGFLQSLLSTAGLMLSSIGRTDIMRTLGIVNSAIFVASFFIGLRFGLTGLVIAYFCATVLITAVSLQITLARISCTLYELLHQIWKQTLCALAMAGLLVVLDGYLKTRVPAIGTLAILVLFGASFYGLSLFMFSRASLVDLQKVISRGQPDPSFVS
jgi:O-antigen/teichoic acid export membrane protein